MKIDFDTKILDHKGKEIVEGRVDEQDVLMTLGSIVAGSLLMFIQKDQNLGGKEKSRRFKLAMKAADGGVQDFPVSDVNYILERLGETQPPLIYGRAEEVLDPELKEVSHQNKDAS